MSKKIRLQIKTAFNKIKTDTKSLEQFGARQISTQKRKNGDLFILFSVMPENEDKFIEFAGEQGWSHTKS